MFRLLVPLLGALTGCTSESVELLAPDASRTGEDGALGPFGVALRSGRVQARVTEGVPLDLIYPADGLDPAVADAPTVVYVHGGFVTPERYRWQAVHWASRGYVVAMPKADWLLAITQTGNGRVALDVVIEGTRWPDLDGVASPEGPFAVGGHSLGGVVSSMQWVSDERVRGLMLFASYPAGSTDVASRSGQPVLALSGDEDDLATPDDVTRGLQPLEEGLFFGLIEGMNHYAWTDDATASELRRDGEATRGIEALRLDADRVSDTWLDAWLRDDVDALDALEQGLFPGVEVQ